MDNGNENLLAHIFSTDQYHIYFDYLCYGYTEIVKKCYFNFDNTFQI